MLKRIKSKPGIEPRYAFFINGKGERHDVAKICGTDGYRAHIILGVMTLGLTAIGVFVTNETMTKAFLAHDIPMGWAGAILGMLITLPAAGCTIACAWKFVEEAVIQRHQIDPDLRVIYSDSVPFAALIKALGDDWDRVLGNVYHNTVIGGALKCELNTFLDDTYVTYVTPDGVLTDDTMSALAHATLDARVKQTTRALKSSLKKEDQRKFRRTKEAQVDADVEAIAETERKSRNLAVAARA